MESSYRKTALDTTINITAFIILIPLDLIRLPLLTKNLTLQDYGRWGQLKTTVSLSIAFTSLGLGTAMTRFLASEENREELQEGFYSILLARLLICLIIALVVFLFAFPIAMYFFDGAVQIVQISAALIVMTTLEPIYMRLVTIFRQVKVRTIINITDGYARIGLFAALLLTGHELLSIILAILAVKVVVVIFLIFWVSSQIGFKRPKFSRMKEYLRFSLPTVPSSIGFWLVNLSDRYVIAYLLGATSVGIYYAGYSIGQLPFVISGLLHFIMPVAIFQLYDTDRMEEVKNHLSYLAKYFLAVTIPFIFGAAVMAKPVLMVLTTPEIATHAWPVVQIIALSFLFFGIYNVVQYILLATKKTKPIAFIWTISAIVNLGLNILVVPYWGIVGAAITTLIAYFLVMCITCYFAFKEFTFNTNWSFIVKSLLASAVMSLVLWLMAPQGTVYTLLTVVVGIVVYGVMIVTLRGFTKTEFEFFKGLLRRPGRGGVEADISDE